MGVCECVCVCVCVCMCVCVCVGVMGTAHYVYVLTYYCLLQARELTEVLCMQFRAMTETPEKVWLVKRCMMKRECVCVCVCVVCSAEGQDAAQVCHDDEP